MSKIVQKKLYPNQPNTGCHPRLHPWWPRLFLDKYTCKTTREGGEKRHKARKTHKRPEIA